MMMDDALHVMMIDDALHVMMVDDALRYETEHPMSDFMDHCMGAPSRMMPACYAPS